MGKERKLIYFPSLSSGNSKEWYLKDAKMIVNDNMPMRFYDEFYETYEGGKYHYPYFLISFGHNSSEPDFRKKMGLENSLVIGDSGGYQIATASKKFDQTFLQDSFTWLENNSSIALNLDIPPWNNIYKWEESLNMSFENFKYFEKNQTGKTKFLNILHGPNEHGYNTWYEKVKDFEFNGWSVGSLVGNQYNMIYATALLLEKKELLKKNIKWVHFLGVGSPLDFFIANILQHQINKITDNKVNLSLDTSSPNRATIYGTYYFDCNYRNLSYTSFGFTKSNFNNYNPNAYLPCSINCPACKNITFKQFVDAGSINDQSKIMTNHNLWVYKQINENIEKIIDLSDESIMDIFGSNNFNIYKALIDITESLNPLHTFEKYKSLFMKYSNKEKQIASIDIMKEFFSFE